jgi:hypothetical protein
MTAALLAILVVVLIVLGIVLWLRRPDRWLAQRTTRRVVLHTTDSQSIDGLLMTVAPDGIVLSNAIYLDNSAEPVQMGGEIWVPRDKVAMVQIRSDAKNESFAEIAK